MWYYISVERRHEEGTWMGAPPLSYRDVAGPTSPAIILKSVKVVGRWQREN